MSTEVKYVAVVGFNTADLRVEAGEDVPPKISDKDIRALIEMGAITVKGKE